MNWTSPNTNRTLRDDEQSFCESYLKFMTPMKLFYYLFVRDNEESWEAEVDFCLENMSHWVDKRTIANQSTGEEDSEVAITMADYYTWHMGCWSVASWETEWEDWWNNKLNAQLLSEGHDPETWKNMSRNTY